MSYRICTKTIMDTTDPDIVFDENGVSNHVAEYEAILKRRVPEKDEAEKLLKKIVADIKASGRGKKYDCLVGVSGGVDSTYTAYAVKELGLRPLAVHLDNGWNSELSVSNIEKVLDKLDIDLYTHVLDWEEFKDLQLSFLKASTPDGEIPTDHAILGTLYRVASKFGIKYLISGSNIKTEGILPSAWAQGHMDWKYISGVQKKFGKKKLKTFPYLSYSRLFRYIAVQKIKKVNLLDYMNYSKTEAMRVIEGKLGWQYYGGKHYESIYTRFFQGYILPEKFNIDKRKGHLSTLICSGEITREEALKELENPPYPNEQMMKDDKEFAVKKLGISDEEFEEIMKLPVKSYFDYPNSAGLMKKVKDTYNRLFYV